MGYRERKSMENEKKFTGPAYEFEAKMPLKQAIPLGLQHVFAMFVGNLTPLLIIMGACGIAGGEFWHSCRSSFCRMRCWWRD